MPAPTWPVFPASSTRPTFASCAPCARGGSIPCTSLKDSRAALTRWSSLAATSATATTWTAIFMPRNGCRCWKISWISAGIGRKRTALRWVSAAEGQLFADYVAQLTQSVACIGTLCPDDHGCSLRPWRAYSKTPRIRWLTGMDRHLTDHGNVYSEVNEEQYRKCSSWPLWMNIRRL